MAVSNSSCNSSILNPSVCVEGTGTKASKIALTVTQTDHGFSAGTAVRWNSGVDGNTAEYVAAQANNAYNAEVLGIVSEVYGSSSFELTLSGTVRMNDFFSNTTGSIPAGITRDDVFFLSGYTAGWLDSKRPSTPGWVAKPVITRLADDAEENMFGMVTNYVGSLLGGNIAVSLGSLVPVGTIQAYLGSEDSVPQGWALCDGDGYTDKTVPGLPKSKFSEYHDKVGTRYGWVEVLKTEAATEAGDRIEQVVNGRTISGVVVGASGGVEADGFRYIFVKQSPDNNIPNNGNFMTLANEDIRGSEPNETDTISGTKYTLYEFERSKAGTAFTVIKENGLEFTSYSHHDSSDVAGVYSVLVPNLRNKFLMGSTEELEDVGRNEIHPLNQRGGHDKFSLDFSTSGGDVEEQTTSTEMTSKGSGLQYQNGLPPYVTVNWIIRTDPNAYASLIDTLEIKNLRLTNLPTSDSGQDQWTVWRDTSSDQLKIKSS